VRGLLRFAVSLFGNSSIVLKAIVQLQAMVLDAAVELRDVRTLLKGLVEKGNRMAVDLAQLKTDLAALVASEKAAEAAEKADLALISDNIAALKAQLANGGPVTQADLDALDSQVQTVSSGLQTIVSNLDTAAKPAVAPTPLP